MFNNVIFTTVSKVALPVFPQYPFAFFFYICMVLSYFVIDTHLSNEAVMKLKLSFRLKLSNPNVDKLFGVLGYNIYLFLIT